MKRGQQAYSEGKQQALSGNINPVNPYVKNTIEEVAWWNGYFDHKKTSIILP